MSIVLPSVLNMTNQKAENYIADSNLRGMHTVDILNVYYCYQGNQFADDHDVLLANNSSSTVKVF